MRHLTDNYITIRPWAASGDRAPQRGAAVVWMLSAVGALARAGDGGA